MSRLSDETVLDEPTLHDMRPLPTVISSLIYPLPFAQHPLPLTIYPPPHGSSSKLSNHDCLQPLTTTVPMHVPLQCAFFGALTQLHHY